MDTKTALFAIQQNIVIYMLFFQNLTFYELVFPLFLQILALAMERDKTTTNSPETTSAAGGFNLLEALAPSNTRESTKIANVDGKAASIDDIVKDLNAIGLNSVTPSTLSKTYGNSNDAILAALLKEQGIEPSTPKTLRDRLNLAVSIRDVIGITIDTISLKQRHTGTIIIVLFVNQVTESSKACK